MESEARGRRSLDDALKLTGTFGRFHAALMILNICFQFFVPWITQVITFIGETPDYFCKPATIHNQTYREPADFVGTAVPPELSTCERYVDPLSRNETEDCVDGWSYSNETFGETLVVEFDLVCSTAWVTDFAQSSMMLGGAFGSVIAGLIANHVGRRPVIICSLAVYLACGCGLIFVPNMTVFIILFTIYGATQPAFWSNCHILFQEYLVPSKRSVISSFPPFFQSLGSVSLGVLAYFVRDWRYLQAIMISPFILLLSVVWLVPESARWHISKGKVNRSEKILKRIAVINRRDSQGPFLYEDALSQQSQEQRKLSSTLDHKHSIQKSLQTVDEERGYDTNNVHTNKGYNDEGEVDEAPLSSNSCVQEDVIEKQTDGLSSPQRGSHNTTPDSLVIHDNNSNKHRTSTFDEGKISTISARTDDAFQESKKEDIDESNSSFFDVFKPPVLYITLAVCAIRVVYTMVYFGFVLNTGNLAGNPYLNFVIGGLIEIPARFIPVILMKKLGSRFIATTFFFLSAITLTGIVLLPEETEDGKSLGTVITSVSLFGRFLVTITNAPCLLLPMELFPTTVRTVGTGVVQFFGRLGGFIAPLMLYLDNVFPGFSLIVMAVGSLTASVLAFLLPETLNEPQPETAEDLKKLMEKKRRFLPRRTTA